MGKKLLQKAGLISAPLGVPKPSEPALAASEAARPKTAPGSMLHFMSQQSTAIREVEELKDRLKEFEGANPVRMIDASLVVPSKWANRHLSSFATLEFEALKEEIRAAGGNVQPIKVRPARGALHGATPDMQAQYEVVFGHRRHRACLELGLPVLAVVEETSDLDLFQQMERENRARKNLSAWEQGCMYRQALDTGLYPSLRKLAEGVGVDVSMVSRSVALARLPDAVIEAFPSPLEIQFGWAADLGEAVQKDPEGTLKRANALKSMAPRLGARQVFEALTKPGEQALHHATPAAIPIQKSGHKVASLTSDAKGRTLVRIEAGVLREDRRAALARLIEGFLVSD
ncbi:ParB/RepB/Spo0J family partition protein [Caldimonas tepidiphila]|uniref:ParB/RepB/Spo0J family partition protein n=1 Tax=Caldimonas tepidiphila TaxID=2315841 RepID=UPI000E5AC960|nr:ParB/RepB/Spo0J family partition protein [Caldimonas tepidiphila]